MQDHSITFLEFLGFVSIYTLQFAIIILNDVFNEYYLHVLSITGKREKVTSTLKEIFIMVITLWEYYVKHYVYKESTYINLCYAVDRGGVYESCPKSQRCVA